MEMRRHDNPVSIILYTKVKNSRVQEPNVETDHLESSTSGSANLLKNRSFDPTFQPTRQDVCWSGWDALLHQNQPDGQVCSAYLRQAHVSSSSNGGLQTMLSLFHTHLPLRRWERTLTSKSFRFPGMVEPCGYNPAKYNTHIGAAMYRNCQNRPSH